MVMLVRPRGIGRAPNNRSLEIFFVVDEKEGRIGLLAKQGMRRPLYIPFNARDTIYHISSHLAKYIVPLLEKYKPDLLNNIIIDG